jgi:hypothetical protein
MVEEKATVSYLVYKLLMLISSLHHSGSVLSKNLLGFQDNL